jgi:hypothetical protein
MIKITDLESITPKKCVGTLNKLSFTVNEGTEVVWLSWDRQVVEKSTLLNIL